jgi:hypothetical protein
MGSVLGTAVKGHRTLEPAESWSLVIFAASVLALTLVAILLPRLIAYPIVSLSGGDRRTAASEGAASAPWTPAAGSGRITRRVIDRE